MKKHFLAFGNQILTLLIIMLFTTALTARENGTDQSIAKIRKGELVIKAKPGVEVSVEQLKHDFWFGCAITNSIVGNGMSESDKKMYEEKFLENFNAGVTENAVKWANMEPRQGEVNYTVVDGILKWADENDIPLRGHNIFWGISRFVQPWVKALDDTELRKTLENRAESLASRYKGRFAEYDLNNEMLHGNYYQDRLGPGITKLMAQWFHNGDPNARLFLNDYDILTGNRLSDYMAQIRGFLKQGIPIAGIGVQGHLHGDTFDRARLKQALDSLATFGIPIRITEFNMPGQRSQFYNNRSLAMTPEQEEQKAKDIVDYYRICFAHPQVAGIMMWGFWAGSNWIPVSSLYKRDWTPTPAAKAYHDLIYKEWWTKTSGKTGNDGTYKVSAFYGKYKITAGGVSKEVNFTKAAGQLEVDF